MAQTKHKKTMEERLKNIEKQVNNVEIPEGSNVANVLLNSLRSKDQPSIEAIICIEEQLIIHAVQRLRKDVIQGLIKELTTLIQEKRSLYQSGSLWLKHLIQRNTYILSTSPNLVELTPLTNIVQQRIAFQEALRSLQGKIKYFLNHMGNKTSDKVESDEILDSNAGDQSDSDGLDMYESPNEEQEEVSEEDDEESSS